jgi:hypothetical protein
VSNRRRPTNPAAAAQLDQFDAARAESDRFQVSLTGWLTTIYNGKTIVADTNRTDSPIIRRQQQWNRADIRAGCPHTQNPTASLGLLHLPGVLFCLD